MYRTVCDISTRIFFIHTIVIFLFLFKYTRKKCPKEKIKSKRNDEKKIFGIYLNENTARPQLREVCVLVWGIESLFEANDDDYNDDDDGDDYNGINDQKELKFRLKTHTHGIRNSNNNFTGHAQIHYTRLPLPNVYMATMSVLFASLYSVEIQKCCVCFFAFFSYTISSCLFFVVSRRNIFTLTMNRGIVVGLVVHNSFDGRVIFDGFFYLLFAFFPHSLFYIDIDIFFNARDCFFLIRCNFSVFIKSKLCSVKRRKAEKIRDFGLFFSFKLHRKFHQCSNANWLTQFRWFRSKCLQFLFLLCVFNARIMLTDFDNEFVYGAVLFVLWLLLLLLFFVTFIEIG